MTNLHRQLMRNYGSTACAARQCSGFLIAHSHPTVPELCKPNYMTAEHTAKMAENISPMKW